MNMPCRVLSYYDLYKFKEEDSLVFEVNEKAFKSLTNVNSILMLDESVRDICFQGNNRQVNSDHQRLKTLNIHSCVLNEAGFPYKKTFKRGITNVIELLEDVSVLSNNVFRLIKLNEFLEKEGFVITQSSFLPANKSLNKIAVTYLGNKKSYSLENYVNVFQYEFFLLS